MATPKKEVKIRDSEVSKRKMLDAVGEIVRTSGVHELKVNRIAQVAELDKGLIRYHFKGLNNLLRTYIDERDYWPPFFERYKIDESADQNEIKEMFIALMQENLKLFYADKEMQKIILWQITKSSPLLRNISEAREDQGEKLFKLTDETFLKSGVSFKAVIALLLGGTYFAVLQAHSIKSRVCGIDLNWEHDFKIFQRTIAQIISWAYEKANEENKSSTMPMNYELETLERLINDTLRHNENVPDAEPSVNLSLQVEAEKVERLLSQQLLTLTNETQIITFLQVYLGRLIKLCNRLYRKEMDSNSDAEVILGLIEALRSPVSQYVPETIILPYLFRDKESKRFKYHWAFVLKPLQESGIDQKLIDIMYIPVKQFSTSKDNMRWCDFKFLKRYLGVLEELTSNKFTIEMLLDTLIGLGYNYSRFTAYYTGVLKTKIADHDYGQTRRILKAEQARLFQISIYTKRDFDTRKLPVLEELGKWIDAELIRHEDRRSGINPFKLVSRLKAVQLAFWKKLEYDHGIYEEDNLDTFSEKITYNYSTKLQEELSAPSMKSKFYPKDGAIYRAIEKILLAMLEDVRKFL
jgi:AcrR family transcriptional regulator